MQLDPPTYTIPYGSSIYSPIDSPIHSPIHSPPSPILAYGGSKDSSSIHTNDKNHVGGNAHNFKIIRRLLERIAEPKHDFGSDRSVVKHLFDSKYDGYLTDEYKAGERDQDIKDIETLTTSAVNENSWWSTKFLQKFLPNFESYLYSSDMEPKIFQSLFMIDSLSINGKNNPIYNSKFKFYAFKDGEGSYIEMIINSSKQKISKKIDAEFAEVFSDYLGTKDMINMLIYDTSSGISNCSRIVAVCIKNSILKHTPIVNIWDPGSASPAEYVKLIGSSSSKPKQQSLFRTTFLEESVLPNIGLWSPKRKNIEDTYSVKANRNEEEMEEEPLEITLNNNSTKYTAKLHKSGLSVLELSIILKKIQDKNIGDITDVEEDTYSIDGIKITRINTILDLFRQFVGSPTIDKTMVYTLNKIVLDMKKTGDWSLVKWVYYWNHSVVSGGNKACLISGDKLCALMSIFNENPTIFGASREITDEMRKVTSEPIIMGYFSGGDIPITTEYIRSLLDYIIVLTKNDTGNDFWLTLLYILIYIACLIPVLIIYYRAIF